MTKEAFQASVIELRDLCIENLEISCKQYVAVEARAKSHEPFDPKLAELERAVYTACKGAVNDLLSYIENKTECKNG